MPLYATRLFVFGILPSYLLGQISSGRLPIASAIRRSPFSELWCSALYNVDSRLLPWCLARPRRDQPATFKAANT